MNLTYPLEMPMAMKYWILVPPTGYIEQNPSTTQSSPGGGVDIPIKENTIEQPITPQENQEGEDCCSQ